MYPITVVFYPVVEVPGCHTIVLFNCVANVVSGLEVNAEMY